MSASSRRPLRAWWPEGPARAARHPAVRRQVRSCVACHRARHVRSGPENFRAPQAPPPLQPRCPDRRATAAMRRSAARHSASRADSLRYRPFANANDRRRRAEGLPGAYSEEAQVPKSLSRPRACVGVIRRERNKRAPARDHLGYVRGITASAGRAQIRRPASLDRAA